MKVILVKQVSNLGKVGEIKEVADGYARNFLIPAGLVKLATETAIKQTEKNKDKQSKKAVKNVRKLKDQAKKIDNLKFIIKSKADDKKTLFGAVNEKTISQELKKRGYDIDAKYIKLDQPIKALGFYEINISFGDDVSAKLGLTITREE